MRIFKTKQFNKWAVKQGITDSVLITAVDEIGKGLVEANLGAHVFKKRIQLPGRGKRGSARSVVAYSAGNKTFFMYGYAKNEKDDINERELHALKLLAAKLLELDETALKRSLKQDELQEIKTNG